jgi:hypothetical protein
MASSQDPDEPSTVDEGSGMSPGEAALIMEQTTRQARRQFNPASPLAALAGASVFLLGYGAVWWSMRDQNPYTGPAGWSIAVLYALIVVNALIGSAVLRRATSGVGGRAGRQMRGAAVAVAAAGIGAWTVEGALRFLGVSFEIVYGVYGPTVPLIALAAVAAGVAATRERWPQLGLCVAFIAIASVSTFFGPLGAWGLTGLGCGLVLLGYAAALVLGRHRPIPAQP